MDFDLIKNQVRDVINKGNAEKNFKVDKLMDKWRSSKERIINEWGGKLQIETGSTIIVEKSNAQKDIEYHNFIDDVAFSMMRADIKLFLEEQGVEAFYENKVVKDFTTKKYEIKAGMKISRALKKFITDKQCLEFYQNKYSLILQSVKVTGKLCLSVHPLDYLTISENNCNWRSCHSLDGEYKAGNLSYMMDKVTIVAYLKSVRNVQLKSFPEGMLWNNKKWRCLFFINEDRELIINNKPYPFYSQELVNKSYELIEKIYPNDWQKESQKFSMYSEDLDNIIEDDEFSLHYNDCINGVDFEPMYKTIIGKKIMECKPILIGASTFCLVCEKNFIECSEDYTCYDCGDYRECEICGEYAGPMDIYKVDGTSICSCCYDEMVVSCRDCGALHLNHSSFINYDPINDQWVCSKCQKKKKKKMHKMKQNCIT